MAAVGGGRVVGRVIDVTRVADVGGRRVEGRVINAYGRVTASRELKVQRYKAAQVGIIRPRARRVCGKRTKIKRLVK